MGTTRNKKEAGLGRTNDGPTLNPQAQGMAYNPTLGHMGRRGVTGRINRSSQSTSLGLLLMLLAQYRAYETPTERHAGQNARTHTHQNIRRKVRGRDEKNKKNMTMGAFQFSSIESVSHTNYSLQWNLQLITLCFACMKS